MKVGLRKPCIKKSISARTTGRINRAAKSAVNPLYGKKGMGLINDPERAVKNAIYKRTTVGVGDIYDGMSGRSSFGSGSSFSSGSAYSEERRIHPKWMYFLAIFLYVVLFLFCGVLSLAFPLAILGLIICPIVIYKYWRRFRKEYPLE